MGLPSIVPWYWKAGAVVVLVAVLLVGAAAYRSHVYGLGHADAVAERAARDAIAIVQRTEENAALSIKQDAINAVLTKAKNEELAPVRERVVTQRVYVGAAICGPAAATETESTASSDSADPPGRLVRSDIERDFRALTMAVEEDLATGRACQRFLTENGLVP